jgi:putative chitinase
MITRAMLRTLWPRCPTSRAEAIATVAPALLRKYKITTPQRVAHFMAQISHECSAGTIVRENMNYSAERMFEIFGPPRVENGVKKGHSAKVTREEAAQLAHHPEQIAERVYGLGNPKKAKELGNTQPGDGFRFRGNGMLQLTGRGSHVHIGKLIGFDLAGKPEMLENAAISFECAVAEFVALNCLPAADADDVDTVTLRVNGGRNGLAERKVWLRKWKAALASASAPEAAPDVTRTIDNANQVPPPEEPRGGESDPVKPMSESTIGNGTLIGAGGGVLVMLKGWLDAVREVPDGILNALIAAVQSPYVLGAAVMLGAGTYVYYRRHKMKQQGV